MVGGYSGTNLLTWPAAGMGMQLLWVGAVVSGAERPGRGHLIAFGIMLIIAAELL